MKIIPQLLQGRKTVRDRKILEVHVDKGMSDGQKIVFGGEGDQEPELEPGDLIIVLDEKEHDVSFFFFTTNYKMSTRHSYPQLWNKEIPVRT